MVNKAELTAQQLVIIVHVANEILERALLLSDVLLALDVLKWVLEPRFFVNSRARA